MTVRAAPEGGLAELGHEALADGVGERAGGCALAPSGTRMGRAGHGVREPYSPSR